MDLVLTGLWCVAVVWKPVWAAYRMVTTKKGEEKKAEYRARITEWYEGWKKVLF